MDWLTRRKQRNVEQETSSDGTHRLAKELRLHQLTAIGIGTTIGAGIFILIGAVAKQRTGPALPLSFLVAGLAAALSALNYAELSSRMPSAGSAYHYAYTCLGECFAWLVGWCLILEYTVSGATVARGVSPNLAVFLQKRFPSWLDRMHVPGTNLVADPFAGFLVIVTSCVLCTGIKQSAGAQLVMTSLLVGVLLFVDFAGMWIGFKNGWHGYELSSSYLPFGVNGVLRGAATLFFSYVGFDALATTAEEVKNPQRDLPIGIGLALFICASLYMSVGAVVVGIEPYYQLNIDTPISSAFARNGMQWASYVIALGALAAMFTTMLGCFLPQPRILMAMARDGLLPPFFSVVHHISSVPVNSAVITGLLATLMAVFLDVEQLSEMVSVGTLVAFSSVALCVLVIRYVPPEEASNVEQPDLKEALVPRKELAPGESGKRVLLQLAISCVLVGSILFSFFFSLGIFPRWLQWSGTALGGLTYVAGVTILLVKQQHPSHRSFGNSGGFLCPCVPLLPVISILVNIYLLLNVGGSTWVRVSIWIAAGVVVYVAYGAHHSVHRAR